MSEKRKPWGFCETPEENCTMNYCDENGCQNRVRHLVEPTAIDRSSLPELNHCESRSTRKLYLYNPETGVLEGPEADQRRIQQAFDEFSQLVLSLMDEIMSRPISDPEKHHMLRQFRRNKRNKSRFVKNHFDTLKF